MRKRDKNIDKCLNRLAGKQYDSEYLWWWDGNIFLADAIASLCRHLRREGTSAYTRGEIKELKTLERWMRAISEQSIAIGAKEQWLHAEAMYLLGKWFLRLWD